jgi:hypothetical protein
MTKPRARDDWNIEVKGMSHRERLDFMRAVLNYFECGADLPEADAWRLTVHGGCQPSREQRKVKRDEMLAELVRSSEAWRSMPVIRVAAEISAAARAYKLGAWKTDKARSLAPSYEPQATFYRILKMEECIPATKQLSNILRREIQ